MTSSPSSPPPGPTPEPAAAPAAGAPSSDPAAESAAAPSAPDPAAESAAAPSAPAPAAAAASALLPPLAAALLAALLDLGGALTRETLPAAPLALALWITATAALIAALALTVDLTLAALAALTRPLLRGPLARAAAALDRRTRGPLAIPLFALGLTAGLAAWIADLTLYVRLYPGWHAALGLAALTALTLAIRAAARATGPLAPRRPFHALALALAAAAIAHLALIPREATRAALLDDGVLAADAAWLGARLTDLDGDGAGVLFTRADAWPLDPDRTLHDPCFDHAAIAATAPSHPPATARPHNVLLITVDALRADHAPPDGARFMPAIAHLATTAAVFRHAYAPAAMTIPSIAALHTGRHPWALAWGPTSISADERVHYPAPAALWPRAWPGGRRVATPAFDRHPTLAERLAAAGHATAGFVSHENFLAPFGLGRGFTRYPAAIVREHNPRGVAITGAAVTDHTLAFIAEHRDRPWFAWAHYFDPHNPYRWPPGTDTTDDTPLARYRAEILYTDVQIARLLLALDRAGLTDRTLVVFTADHGEAFGERGAEYHSSGLYEELVRVPLLIRAPGLAPRVIDDPVSTTDIAPTLAARLGLPLPTAQGRDLGPLLRGEPAPEAPILAETLYRDYHRTYMLREGDHKLIWDHLRGTRRLYDLAADPHETDNRIDDDPARAAAMTARLCAALHRTARLDVPPAPPGPPVPLYADP